MDESGDRLCRTARLGCAAMPRQAAVDRARSSRRDTDIEMIARWWREHPDANVGVACGAASGIDVIDVDGEAGRATLAEPEDACGPVPATPRQVTGSGGLHLIFAYDPARPIGNRVRRLPGIDTRSDAGYIVVSPSTHPNGRLYRWDPDLHPLKVRPAPMPQWLAELLMPAVDPSPVGQARPSIEEEAGWGPKSPLFPRCAPSRVRGDRELPPLASRRSPSSARASASARGRCRADASSLRHRQLGLRRYPDGEPTWSPPMARPRDHRESGPSGHRR